MPKGTEILSLTGGGGGYGNPLDRAPDAVRNDVLEKYISEEHARSTYGVVLDEDHQVDAEQTARLRREMRAAA